MKQTRTRRSSQKRLMSGLFGLVLTAAACSATPISQKAPTVSTSPQTATTTNPGDLAFGDDSTTAVPPDEADAVGYTEEEAVALFSDEPCTEGLRGREVVVEAVADVTGDGLDDFVISNFCYEGTSVYSSQGVLVTGAGEQMELSYVDPNVVASLGVTFSADEGAVTAEWYRFGPEDPICCPSIVDVVEYKVVGNSLAPSIISSPTSTPTAPTTEAPTDITDQIVQVTRETAFGSETFSVYESTRDQYPPDESFYWAIGITYFVVEESGQQVSPDQDCAAREFLRSEAGQRLVKDDLEGNSQDWNDSEGYPIQLQFELADWLSNQTVC